MKANFLKEMLNLPETIKKLVGFATMFFVLIIAHIDPTDKYLESKEAFHEKYN